MVEYKWLKRQAPSGKCVCLQCGLDGSCVYTYAEPNEERSSFPFLSSNGPVGL